MFLACEDNPKVCTGRKAVRQGLATEMSARHRPSPKALFLDPHVSEPLTRRDTETFELHGLIAVDCSWNKLGERGGYPGGPRGFSSFKARRRLPLLIAANPQHYGRLTELNTAEALGAALYVMKGEKEAEQFLASFSFGPSFMALNGVLLKEYHDATGPEGITEIEGKYLTV